MPTQPDPGSSLRIRRISLRTPRNLVGVPLSGGLGNQMFQYATALAVAERAGGLPYFDLRYFARPDARPLELPAFGIDLPQWVPTLWRLDGWARMLSRNRWRPGPERVTQSHEIEAAVFSVGTPCYLRGFFQSERYFEAVKERVRASFDTDLLATPRTLSLEQQMRNASAPVVIHVRRGDYGTTAFPRIGRDHYDRARREIERHVRNPTYFLFSDDIADAAAMLSEWPDLVPVSGFSGLEDFRLMSLGRHFLIANSTFSWWAAWLGRAADKIVVAPTTWFGHVFMQPNAPDSLLPASWIRV